MKPYVAICIPLKNRMGVHDLSGRFHPLFPACFRSVRHWIQEDPSRDYTVIIDDWHSTDVDIRAWLREHALGVDTVVLKCARSGFNRGHSRNRMALEAQRLGADHLFFLDADVTIDARAIPMIRPQKGEAVFPMCERIRTADKKSRRPMSSSHGLLYVATQLYFDKLHPWLEKDDWGGDDALMAKKAKEAGIYVRAFTKNYMVHNWHPTDQQWKDRLCQ